MNLPKLAVQRPITTLMMLLSVLVVGGIALQRLPLAFLPEVDVPWIGIEVSYPNSNPTQVEKEIVKPIEETLATLSGVKSLNATATADGAFFELEFRWGQDLDVARMQVSEKVEQVKGELPPGIGNVFIYSFNTNDIPVVQGRIAAEGVDLAGNYDLIEARILNRLRRIPGVARVDLNGVAPREVSIDLVLAKVQEHNIDVGQLIGKLQGASSNLVLGHVDDGGLRYTARALGRFASLEEVGNLVIDPRGIRLRDIAEITYEEPPIAYGRHLDRQYAVAIDVYKESTANTVDVVRAVNRVIAEDIDQDPLLQGVKLFVWQDQADQIVSGIDGLKSSGLVGGLLAVLVLYFFLRRLDSTSIVALSIPFSVVAACGVMYFMGKTLNVLSMMGLMLGIGMLVDNAIVVLESIDRRHRDEPDPKKASLQGAGAVAMAVTASTLTTLIVFLPLIVGGQNELTTWLREVGIAISLALVCSLFSSLTLIPLVAAHYLKPKEVAPARAISWLEERYVRVLGWTLRHRVKAAALGFLAFVMGIVPFAAGLVDSGMFSAAQNNRLRLEYEFSDFSYKSDSERAVDQVEEFLYANLERFGIESVYSFYGENEAASWLTLSKESLEEEELEKLRKDLRAELPEIPGVRLVFDDDSEEGGSSTRFSVKFYGHDSAVLADLAAEAERRLATVPGIADITTGSRAARREIQVVIDRVKAERLGLDAQDISDVFGFTLGGMRLRRFDAGDREVETWLALRIEDRAELEDLRRLQVASRNGTPVTLGEIAGFEIVRREQEIRRENRRVRTAVRAVYEGEKWGEAKEQIAGLMNAFDLPSGYSWSWDDRVLEQEDQDAQMGINMLLALALVYIVMASLFESLAQPFAILFSIPFALPGAAWLLAATGTPFNMMAQIGLLILMGIVVNNGIVLLDHMNHLRKSGMGREEAILEAGRDRLRPILMTASTTVLGLMPMALGGSTVGGLFYFPLARTVMGGLISSSVLTLLVLPLITLGVEAVADWARQVWRGTGAVAVGAAGGSGAGSGTGAEEPVVQA
jgi:HAE1 family hydrophobic/amphiphilic exporter-1